MKSCLSITSIDLIFVCMPGRVYAWLDNKCIYNILGPRILRSFHMATNFVQIKENHFYFFHSPIRFRFIGLLLLISEPHVNRKNSIFACTNYTMYIWFLNFRLLDFFVSLWIVFCESGWNKQRFKAHTLVCRSACDDVVVVFSFFWRRKQEEEEEEEKKQKREREIESLYTLYLYWFFVIIISKMVRSCHGIVTYLTPTHKMLYF